MARKFQFKRGPFSRLPILAQAEPAITTDSGSERMFVGNGTKNLELLLKRDASLLAVTTAGSGSAYTATVEGITELKNGVSLIMVPHTACTTIQPTLNVNGLGAKGIRRKSSIGGDTVYGGDTMTWIPVGSPVLLVYDNGYWVTPGLTRPVGSDIVNSVPPSKGGTGLTTLTSGSYMVGNGTSNVQMKTPAQVLTDIKALPAANALVFQNKSVATTAWTSSTTYSAQGYNFRASVACTGVTTSHRPSVTFGCEQAVSGNFAPVAESTVDGVYIYAKEQPTAAISIPSIVCVKGV